MYLQHHFFFEELNYFVTGSIDQQGRPWASILASEQAQGQELLTAKSQNELLIQAEANDYDPWFANLSFGAEVQNSRETRSFSKAYKILLAPR